MAMTTDELARPQWRRYFDELSKHLGTVEATVEVTGRDIGDQIAGENMVLRGITYDDKDDLLVVALEPRADELEPFEHMIYNPQRIMVAAGDRPELTYDVVDAEGHQTLIQLERPPALPDLEG